MAAANNVARFFVYSASRYGQTITHMKLQKLCFYAQALHVVRNQETLISETFEAWDHGPVCPELYQEYKRYENRGIDFIIVHGFDPLSVFDDKEYETLEETWLLFGNKSAGDLRNLSHREAPWKDTYQECPGDEIPVPVMYRFYSSKFGELDRYDQLLREYRAEFREDSSSHEVEGVWLRQLHENHLLVSPEVQEATKDYVERVK